MKRFRLAIARAVVRFLGPALEEREVATGLRLPPIDWQAAAAMMRRRFFEPLEAKYARPPQPTPEARRGDE